jgi:uncharacterized Zn-binding protein involved in type VI secretion
MKNVVVKGDSSIGIHDYPSTCTSGSSNVFINGKPVCTASSTWSNHTKYISEDYTETHSGLKAISTSSSVYVNGNLIIRNDDSLTCGDKVVSSISDVFSN